MKYPLCFIIGYVHPVTQHYEISISASTNTTSKERNGAAPQLQCILISLSSESEVSITFRCQLCSTCYKARTVQKVPLKVSTMKNTDDFCYEGKSSCAITKPTLFAVSKDEWDAKEVTGKCIVCVFTPKGTSQAEAMSNSENSSMVR